MKYFSFATDFTYNRFAINSQTFYLTDINLYTFALAGIQPGHIHVLKRFILLNCP